MIKKEMLSRNNILFVLVCIALTACANKKKEEVKSIESKPVKETIELKNRLSDTTFIIKDRTYDVEVLIKTPADSIEVKGNMLLLHGWNFPNDDWCNKTELCSKALAKGYNIIAPSFGKSTYQWELFPETIEKYRIYPSRKWMYDSLLTHLQNEFEVLKENQFNVVVGLSTGGRGAALFALEKPVVFNGCAALSADFDQTQISDEPINNGFYGSYADFPERWEGRDNIQYRANEFKVPIYLGHGVNDKMCPVSQTEIFSKKLKEVNPSLNQVLNLPAAEHNYEYWNSEINAILAFFEENRK